MHVIINVLDMETLQRSLINIFCTNKPNDKFVQHVINTIPPNMRDDFQVYSLIGSFVNSDIVAKSLKGIFSKKMWRSPSDDSGCLTARQTVTWL